MADLVSRPWKLSISSPVRQEQPATEREFLNAWLRHLTHDHRVLYSASFSVPSFHLRFMGSVVSGCDMCR
jgi:hypothetical protein